MSMPRRSARLAPQQHTSYDQSQQHRPSSSAPSFAQTSQSQPSSTSTTSFPSPTNDLDSTPSHHPTHSHSHPHLQVHPSFMPQYQHSHLNAPLPSPSANEMDPFFGRPHSQPNPYSSHPHHQQNPQQGLSYNPPQQQQQQQQHMHHNSFSQHSGMSGHQNQPGVMPQDFLAEAAKRAQMACLMRDLNDVSL